MRLIERLAHVIVEEPDCMGPDRANSGLAIGSKGRWNFLIMFQLLFKYPIVDFLQGRVCPARRLAEVGLLLLVLATAAGLALLIRARLPQAAPQLELARGRHLVARVRARRAGAAVCCGSRPSWSPS